MAMSDQIIMYVSTEFAISHVSFFPLHSQMTMRDFARFAVGELVCNVLHCMFMYITYLGFSTLGLLPDHGDTGLNSLAVAVIGDNGGLFLHHHHTVGSTEHL